MPLPSVDFRSANYTPLKRLIRTKIHNGPRGESVGRTHASFKADAEMDALEPRADFSKMFRSAFVCPLPT